MHAEYLLSKIRRVGRGGGAARRRRGFVVREEERSGSGLQGLLIILVNKLKM